MATVLGGAVWSEDSYKSIEPADYGSEGVTAGCVSHDGVPISVEVTVVTELYPDSPIRGLL